MAKSLHENLKNFQVEPLRENKSELFDKYFETVDQLESAADFFVKLIQYTEYASHTNKKYRRINREKC